MRRVVEVSSNDRYLHATRGFLAITDNSRERVEIGRVPLEDIESVIVHGYGISYSNDLLVRLTTEGIPLVMCDDRHLPVGILLPLDGHSTQAKRFDAQIAASLPLAKRTWAAIVKAKIAQQGQVLDAVGQHRERMTRLEHEVRSGDPMNCEAQAAREYWPALFGSTFRRDRARGDHNALLNYGYTVLRATMARAVVAAGLHPTLGIHHQNEGNAMRLVDDLMEPFRPFIDLRVWMIINHSADVPAWDSHVGIQPEHKLALVNVLSEDLETDEGTTPIAMSTARLATSLARVYLGEAASIALPPSQIPAAWREDIRQALLKITEC